MINRSVPYINQKKKHSLPFPFLFFLFPFSFFFILFPTASFFPLVFCKIYTPEHQENKLILHTVPITYTYTYHKLLFIWYFYQLEIFKYVQFTFKITSLIWNLFLFYYVWILIITLIYSFVLYASQNMPAIMHMYYPVPIRPDPIMSLFSDVLTSSLYLSSCIVMVL